MRKAVKGSTIRRLSELHLISTDIFNVGGSRECLRREGDEEEWRESREETAKSFL